MAVETGFVPHFGNKKGVVWAADVEPDDFAPTMEAIGDAEGLVGVKIGFEVALGLGLAKATNIVRANSNAKVQYDHQKAANDIPDTHANFTRAMVRGGVDSAILFPFTGPKTQEDWTRSLDSAGITVFTGAEMTHKRFRKVEGGSIPDTSLGRIIDLALDLGVENFILPGNKVQRIQKWRRRIEAVRGAGNYALASPGLVNQGGNVTASGQAAGEHWHPIIGRGIHDNPNLTPREAVECYTRVLRAGGAQ